MTKHGGPRIFVAPSKLTVKTGVPPARTRPDATKRAEIVDSWKKQIADLRPGMYIEVEGASSSILRDTRKKYPKMDISYSAKEKKMYIWNRPVAD